MCHWFLFLHWEGTRWQEESYGRLPLLLYRHNQTTLLKSDKLNTPDQAKGMLHLLSVIKHNHAIS